MEFSIDELICVCISRQVEDGEVLAQGLNTPLVMAGFILAKLTHAPHVRFASAIGQSITQEWGELAIARVEDVWLRLGLLHVSFVTAAADLLPKYQPKEFFRPAQVDSVGNFNNIALTHPRMRLPGSGGIPDVTTFSNRVHLYVPRHSKVTFVERVDLVSGLGHVSNRHRGSGPRYLITDLGQFDWENGRMRLTHVHPGVSVEQIQKKTGFALEISSQLQETPAPSPLELELLRDKIDPLGVRRLETLGGTARKTLLREILAREGAL